MQCLNFFQLVNPNELFVQVWIQTNTTKTIQKDVILKFIFNIQQKCVNYIMIIFRLQVKYQLMISDFYKILNDNVKKLVPKFFVKEKYMLHHENVQLFLRVELKLKVIHRVLELNQLQWLKLYAEFNIKKEQKKKKTGIKTERHCASCLAMKCIVKE